MQCSILSRRVEGIYKEYIQTTYTRQRYSKNVQIKWKQINNDIYGLINLKITSMG